MHLLHWTRSCAISAFKFHIFRSSFKHSHQVFLPLPLPPFPSTLNSLQAVAHLSLSIRSKCLNHRNLLLLSTSVTHSIPKREIISSLFFLHDEVTPHILLTIALSVRNSLLASSIFMSQVSLP